MAFIQSASNSLAMNLFVCSGMECIDRWVCWCFMNHLGLRDRKRDSTGSKSSTETVNFQPIELRTSNKTRPAGLWDSKQCRLRLDLSVPTNLKRC